MHRRYANPPIIEAVCEFRLTTDTIWDLTIPGLVYEKIKEKFPHREQRVIQEFEIITGPQGLMNQIYTSERIMLFSEDRKIFIQLGPRLLAVHSLRPYPTWKGFKPNIEMAFESLTRTVEIKGVQRIGLRYINRIEIPSSPIKLEDYFQFYLFLGPQFPQDMTNFIASSEFAYAKGRDQCRVQLTSARSSTPQGTALTLDIDYFLAQERGVEVQDAMNWVEEAHDMVEEVFEGCISDRLRELFQEVK